MRSIRKIPRWVHSVLFVPLLYLFGWISVRFAQLLFPYIPSNKVDLAVTLVTFLIFLILLPTWVKVRWGDPFPWKSLGVVGFRKSRLSFGILKGLFLAASLLGLIGVWVVCGNWAQWETDFYRGALFDVLFLFLVVGFGEELIFRGWLWGELNHIAGPRFAFITQGVIFSLAHTRFDSDFGLTSRFSLSLGLFLLGLLLAVRRNLDNGSIWGCVALHGGLVAGWFAFSKILFKISPSAPAWLIGPGGHNSNPIGGVFAISVLICLLAYQLKAFDMSRRPLRGEWSASSKGANPYSR